MVTLTGQINVAGRLQHENYTPPDTTIKFVAVSANNIYSSVDGITWSITQANWNGGNILSRCFKCLYDGVRWIVLSGLDSGGGVRLATSTDGLSWSISSPASLSSILPTAIASSGSRFIIAARAGGNTVFHSSTNLTSWSNIDSYSGRESLNIFYGTNNTWYCYAYSGGAQAGDLLISTANGMSWSSQYTEGNGSSQPNTANMVLTNTRKIISSPQYQSTTSGQEPRTRYGVKGSSSNDWVKFTNGFQGCSGLATGNGYIIETTNAGTFIRRMIDSATSFNAVNTNITFSGPGASNITGYNRLAFGDGKFVAAAVGGLYYSTDNGSTWTLSNITTNVINTVASKASI